MLNKMRTGANLMLRFPDVADALVEQWCGAWLWLKDASLPAEKS